MFVFNHGLVDAAKDHLTWDEIPPNCENEIGMPRVIQEVDSNGNIQSKVVFEITPLSERDKGIKVSDLSLGNLIAIGNPPSNRVDFKPSNPMDLGENVASAFKNGVETLKVDDSIIEKNDDN